MNELEILQQRASELDEIFGEFIDEIPEDTLQLTEKELIQISIDALRYTFHIFATKFPDNQVKQRAKYILIDHFGCDESYLINL